MRWTAVCLLLLASIPAAWAGEPLLWFCPLDFFPRPEVGYSGSPDYMRLFAADAPWDAAASRVKVFKIYPQWINRATDADLETQFASLKRRGIALALEYGALTASDQCGRGVEGFGGNTLLTAARRIQRLGGELLYVAMDEPIFFSTLYGGANACKWTLEQMAANAAVNLKALLAEFPEVKIGDIEPLPVDDTSREWLRQYAKGIQAFEAALGFPLAFFHADILWSNDTWPARLAMMRDAAGDRGIPFGVIYNGNASDRTDAAWIAAAESHMAGYELELGTPDHIIFQSWHANPRKLLPEGDADSFTSLINRYFRTHTALTLESNGGSLSEAGGTPLPGARVSITATPIDGAGLESDYVLDGTVPEGVKQAVLGARVNLECGCAAPSEFALKSLRVELPGTETPPLNRDFSAGLTDWGVSDRSLVELREERLRVRAGADQKLLLNSPPIAFPHEKATFRFIVRAQVAPSSSGSGYFTLIFLGDKEISRVRIPIRAAELQVGSVVTTEEGAYEFTAPTLEPGQWLLRAFFGGDTTHWPALAEHQSLSSESRP